MPFKGLYAIGILKYNTHNLFKIFISFNKSKQI